jgi:DNA modification methylase
MSGLAYEDFIAAKAQVAVPAGLDIDPALVHPALLPHQRDIVLWAIRGGRRAIFASFGLGKTLCQLEICRLILAELGSGRALIVCPLGVRQEFARDAGLIGVATTFVRTIAEAPETGICLTNYETVRDGKLDPREFSVLCLDEAAVLRGFGGTKTFRQMMALYEGSGAYRFVATATPSPNDYIELLAYAAFLDILDVGHGKTRFFKRDSEHADRLTILPHMAEAFWLWVSSWALMISKPSDLGHSDEGYELPPLDVAWHEIPSPGPTGQDAEKDGRQPLFRAAAAGVQQAGREKRDSVTARVEAAGAIVGRIRGGAVPDEQIVIWCDRNDEQQALERMLASLGVSCSSLYGSQTVEAREALIEQWRRRETQAFLTKPSMYGAGVNLQQAHLMIFAGIGYKFSELIQGIHRIHRFLQANPCTVHLVHTDAEREIRDRLKAKWAKHGELAARMSGIIAEYGLAHEAMARVLTRSAAVVRREVAGDGFTLVCNDAVLEASVMAGESAHLIVTSIPFSTQYEYTPSMLDFGHSESNEAFWRQMDYLIPHLLRVLQPGRVCVVHVKDRVVPGGMTGLGFQTIYPFHADAIARFKRHGFAFLGMKTIVTDVVRENNQTYRLGWTEQCKDGTKMGAGLPEYLLIFRRPPSDNSRSYADRPVVKDKAAYSRSRWQVDAHGFARSSGNRPLTPDDLAGLPHDQIFRLFRDHGLASVYDFGEHVALGEALEGRRLLPTSFMLLQPPSWHPDVITDIARMRTLNMQQERAGKEQHLCPMPFDIAERSIVQYSMPGETVLDPFMGIGTVPWMALKHGRKGLGIELSPVYFGDAVAYCEAIARQLSAPTLFDLDQLEAVSHG